MGKNIAYLGLGVMGGPMARHLAAAGHNLIVYNRTAEKAATWVAAHGGRTAPTPAAAAQGDGLDPLPPRQGQRERGHPADARADLPHQHQGGKAGQQLVGPGGGDPADCLGV
jgi:hypothetical protein